MRKSRINRRSVNRRSVNRRSVNRRSLKKQNRSRNRKYQKGGKTVLPMRYFTENFNKHYSENPSSLEGQVATSHGVSMNGQPFTGPDLRIAQPQKGGAPQSAEFFGGNSNRYFEEGAPELTNCDGAYGKIIPRSYGVVMDSPNGGWMGPNLSSFPNSNNNQTGGRRTKTKKNKKNKNKKNKKNKVSKKNKVNKCRCKGGCVCKGTKCRCKGNKCRC